MYFFNLIISGGPELFFVAVLWIIIHCTLKSDLRVSWPPFCYLFYKQRTTNPYKQDKVLAKGQFFNSPAGPSLSPAFNPSGLTPVIKSNRPDFRALLFGSVQKAGFLLGIFVFLSFSDIQAATKTSTGTGGNWSAAATWVGGAVPASGDDVTIAAGASVIIDTDPTVGSLLISGTLEFEAATARSITVLTQVTISSRGVFRSAQSGTIKNHQLIVEGSIINDGVLDFSSNSNATGAEIVFTGSSNAIFNCSDAPLTNLKQTNGITLNKGTSAASVLSFTPGDTFQVLSDGSSGAKGFLSIINGTFNIIGSNRFSNTVFNTEGDYTIPATGGFWLGNQNATVIGMNGTVTNLGDLKITNGRYDVGISGGSSLETLAEGQFKMSGGTLTIAGNFKMDGGHANISGGRINLATQANSADEWPTLSMSGRTNLELYGTPVITIAYPNSKIVPVNDIQIGLGGGRKSVTGGTIQLGTEATPSGSSFFVNGDPILDRLTVLNECTIQVFNTSKSDLAITPISALPKIAFDKIAPELTAPPKLTIQCGENQPKVFASLQEFTNAGGAATDNCTLVPASFKLRGQVQSNANCPYTITRTYQISDVSGNVATAQHLIVVEGGAVVTPTETVAESPVKEELKLKSAMAGTITAKASGNWNDVNTWDLGRVPLLDDDVAIPNGFTVTLTDNRTCNNITNNGSLTVSGTNTLQINGNLLNGGTITLGDGKFINNGNWTNNGNFTSGPNGTVEFTGNNSSSIGGTSISRFEKFTLNKTSIANIITVSGNIELNGNLITDRQFTSGLLQVNTGSGVSFTGNAGFTIGTNAGIFINGGSMTTGAFSIDNDGRFQIDSGTITIGTSSGNGIVVRNSGMFDINGGIVNVAGRLEVSGGTVDISGGTLNLNAVGHNSSTKATLDLSLASDFIMSAGTINFLKPNGTGNLDVLIENGVGGNKSFTGGVLNIGTGTSDTYRITSEIPFPPISATVNTNLILEMMVSANGTYNFPLVTNTSAAIPATINLTSNGGFAADASIQIETTGTDHPNNASATNYLNRYWTVTTSGITSPVYDVTAKYADTDIAGTEAEIAMGSYVGGLSPWVKYGNANAGANALSASGITSTSFVFAGITSDPPTVTIDNGPSVAICSGSSVNLTATASGDPTLTYSWSPATGLSATNISNPVASPVSTTTYTVTVTDGNGFTATDVITVNVTPNNTVTAASSTPITCINTPMTAITHTTTGATGLGASTGLPTGVTAAWASNTITISGTPSVSGSFNYSIPLTGGCGTVTATGLITVTPANTVTAASATPTLCINTALTAITHTTTGATSIGVPTGFPAGITAAWASNTITISGTPTVSGLFSYSIPLTGGCGTVTATGLITVTPANTVTAASSTPSLCINTTLTAISHTTTGATGIGAATGLPAGVTASWAPNTITISGTPTVSGTFNYIIPLNGGCSSVNATGTITVNPIPTVSATPVSQTICPDGNFTITITNPNAVSGTTFSWTRDNTAVITGVPVSGTGSSITGILNSTLPQTAQTTTFTITATANGCSSTTTVAVTVIDNTPPTFTAPAATTIFTDASCSFNKAPAQTGSPSLLNDNCTAVPSLITSYTDTATPTTFCTPGNTITRTWSVTDAAGNTTTKTQLITVEDKIAPIITVPPDVTIQCGSSTSPTINATATDNCTNTASIIITYTETSTTGSCDRTITRTWKATDACGNFSTGTQLIRVSDTAKPTVTIPSIYATCASTIPDPYTTISQMIAATVTGTASDNCSVSLTITMRDEIAFGLAGKPGYCPSALDRTYRVTDECGNYTDVIQKVYVGNECECTYCTAGTIFELVDFMGDPDASVTFEDVTRNGKCCPDDVWWTQNKADQYRCVSFNVRLDWDAVGVEIVFEHGATPDVKDWRVDCQPVTLIGNTVCLPGGAFHLFTYCKQGNNPNDITFRSIKGASANSELSTRVECNQNLSVTGVSNPVWKSVYPVSAGIPEGYYNKYLFAPGSSVPGSGVTSTTPVFRADSDAPSEIRYEVCGDLAQTVCNNISRDCDIVTVYVKEKIDITLDINPDLVCEDNIPTITPAITPAGNYTLDWISPNPPGGIFRGPSFTPTVAGTYTVVITDIQGGIPCSTVTSTFTIAFDKTGPNFQVTEPPLEIQCNEVDYVNIINTWRSKFQATYTNAQGNTVTATVTDDFDFSKLNMTCGNVVTVTFTAPDQCVNYSTATSTITIIDLIKPTLTASAQNLSVECDGTGNTTQLNNWLASQGGAAATDDCGTVTWTYSVTPLSDLCGLTGVATATFTVRDACGNAVSTTATFSIVDTTPPSITCPGPYYTNVNVGECVAYPVSFGTATVTDSCGTYTVTNNAPAQFPVGVTTITWTATDACGNVATCSQYVTVADVEPPVITCLNQTITIPAVQDICSAPYTLTEPSYTENCGTTGSATVTVSRSDNLTLSDNYPIGTTTVVWTVTDIYNNYATCTQTITVVDTQSPTINCPDDFSISADNLQNYASNVDIDVPDIFDNCPGYTLTWTITNSSTTVETSTNTTGVSTVPSPYSRLYLGANVISYTLTAANGQQVDCSFIITVTSAPEIACPQNWEIDTSTGTCTSDLDPGVARRIDGGEPMTWVWQLDEPDGGTQSGTSVTPDDGPTPIGIGTYAFKTGTSTITWTATNDAGTASCSHTITVIDKVNPIFTPSPLPIVQCVENVISATYAVGDPKVAIITPAPDYYLLRNGTASGTLDIDMGDLTDNCCPDTGTLTWTITFSAVPGNPSTPGTISGTGQPSAYTVLGVPTDIKLWGDGVNFDPVYHTISYTVYDCHGNHSTFDRQITINPRPELIKMP